MPVWQFATKPTMAAVVKFSPVLKIDESLEKVKVSY